MAVIAANGFWPNLLGDRARLCARHSRRVNRQSQSGHKMRGGGGGPKGGGGGGRGGGGGGGKKKLEGGGGGGRRHLGPSGLPCGIRPAPAGETPAPQDGGPGVFWR